MVKHRHISPFLFFASIFLMLLAVASPRVGHAQTPDQPTGEPDITAASAIVVEYPSGRILYQKDAHFRMPPASLTKILTAILALEYGKLDDVVTVVPEDLVGESTMGLVSGEQQTLHNLLYGMLLPSGNDAALTVARHLGATMGAGVPANGDPLKRFADMMNLRVSQLGLTDSHFVNPHGLDTLGHYSTAYDLASLAWYALHIPTFNEIVRSVGYDAPGHGLLNTNEMLTRYDGADGVKTGWTDGCGLCLVTSATRDGHRLISVVLNAPHWYSDSTALLDYSFAQIAAAPAGDKAEVLSVSKRDTVAWLLANPAGAPPVPEQQQSLAQGGGAGAQVVKDQVEANLNAQDKVGGGSPATGASSHTAPALESASAPDAVPQSSLSIAVGKMDPGLPFILLAFGAAAVVCCLLLARLWRQPVAGIIGRGRALAMAPFGKSTSRATDSAGDMRPSRVQARTFGGPPTAKLPEPNILPSLYSRRREPNLLAAPEDGLALHIESAVALSEQGKQGSAMSEFAMALKAGAAIDIAELAEQHRLTAAAFLALARAQVSLGRPEDARRTLLHGVLVMPNERMLRLSLFQLQHDQ
ncbi:MAG: D-alanyl-D-alanine carboxypeptidase family protein [Chloroflexota bacterium]